LQAHCSSILANPSGLGRPLLCPLGSSEISSLKNWQYHRHSVYLEPPLLAPPESSVSSLQSTEKTQNNQTSEKDSLHLQIITSIQKYEKRKKKTLQNTRINKRTRLWNKKKKEIN
jgi:hypothetical protein